MFTITLKRTLIDGMLSIFVFMLYCVDLFLMPLVVDLLMILYCSVKVNTLFQSSKYSIHASYKPSWVVSCPLDKKFIGKFV